MCLPPTFPRILFHPYYFELTKHQPNFSEEFSKTKATPYHFCYSALHNLLWPENNIISDYLTLPDITLFLRHLYTAVKDHTQYRMAFAWATPFFLSYAANYWSGCFNNFPPLRENMFGIPTIYFGVSSAVLARLDEMLQGMVEKSELTDRAAINNLWISINKPETLHNECEHQEHKEYVSINCFWAKILTIFEEGLTTNQSASILFELLRIIMAVKLKPIFHLPENLAEEDIQGRFEDIPKTNKFPTKSLKYLESYFKTMLQTCDEKDKRHIEIVEEKVVTLRDQLEGLGERFFSGEKLLRLKRDMSNSLDAISMGVKPYIINGILLFLINVACGQENSLSNIRLRNMITVLPGVSREIFTDLVVKKTPETYVRHHTAMMNLEYNIFRNARNRDYPETTWEDATSYHVFFHVLGEYLHNEVQTLETLETIIRVIQRLLLPRVTRYPALML
nr:expressed protein [Hymenolepis microstoma]